MKSFSFWQKWLLVCGFASSIFGIYMSFFSGTVLFKLFDSNVNSIFWGTDNISSNVKEFQRWIYGAWGATVTGWGIFMIFIAHYPFQKKEKWAWNCLISVLLAWFFIDTGFSIYFKVYINVIFNTVLFMLIILPIGFTRKYFVK